MIAWLLNAGALGAFLGWVARDTRRAPTAAEETLEQTVQRLRAHPPGGAGVD